MVFFSGIVEFKMDFIMKKIIVRGRYLLMAWIACVCMAGTPSFSQELTKKQQRQLYRDMKNEQEEDENSAISGMVDLMVDQGRFVLEAYQLRDRMGNMANVSSLINFLSLDSIRGVIQIGSSRYVGANGVGGITVEGPINDYKVKKNEKNGTYHISYTIRTSTGTYDVRMAVSEKGRADANISSTWPGQLNFIGYLVPPGSSKVYKGQVSY